MEPCRTGEGLDEPAQFFNGYVAVLVISAQRCPGARQVFDDLGRKFHSAWRVILDHVNLDKVLPVGQGAVPLRLAFVGGYGDVVAELTVVEEGHFSNSIPVGMEQL
ncbi:hypothetical protein D9M68_870020 [compost metagenome]